MLYKKSCFENERMYYIKEGIKEISNMPNNVPIMNINNNMNNIRMNNRTGYDSKYDIDSANKIYNSNNNNKIFFNN